VQILNSRWQRQTERLIDFLERNQKIAAGLETREGYLSDDTLRPTTATSDMGIMEHVLSNTTPRVERNNPVDIAQGGGMARLSINDENQKGGMGHSETDGEPAPNARSRSESQVTMPTHVFELGDPSVPEIDG
jgi:hypothetical protein